MVVVSDGHESRAGEVVTPPRWSDALRRARELMRRCRQVIDRPVSRAELRAESTGTDRIVETWALVVYAVAVADRCAIADVTPDQVRYRLADQTQCTTWLWDMLRRAGHSVPRPAGPRARRGLAADLESTTTLLGTVSAARNPAADDPVVNCWTLITVLIASSSEMSDGVDDPVGCLLWDVRVLMIRDLDAVLVFERGGWPAGSRVRVHGGPHAITTGGQLAAEAGLWPDRAVVRSPVWQFDHARHTLAAGPPTGYHLRFRTLATGLPHHDVIGPVNPDHLTIDLAPALPNSSSPAHADTPPLAHTIRAGADAVNTAVGAGAPAVDDDVAEVMDELREFAPQTPDGRSWLPRSMAVTDDPFRAAAIARIWHLRDDELALARDSTPQRVAERIAAGEYQAPPPPRDLTMLISSEQLNAHERRQAHQQAPDQVLWTPQHLVTGRPREELRQWLKAMSWATPRQRRVLDGLERRPTLAHVREFLAGEGFTEVLDVHANANANANVVDGRVDLVAVNTEMAWLAALHASASRSGEPPQPQHLRIYYNVLAVDDDLLTYATSNGHRHRDGHGNRTMIYAGSVDAFLAGHNPPDGSLRVRLAALRAFGTPVAPWVTNPHVYIGSDSTPPQEQQRILARLPAAVRALFGAHLTADA